MKKLLVYALAAMFVLPAIDSESKPVAESKDKTEIKDDTGKKKPKKNANKKGKPKRKYVYRPGARQN
ncbi:MAG TPA: hypothetical protein VK927_06490 [Adhaeribacter sp.]|nr:hypothetical protein [Adhaeribacter sp.]